MNLPRRVAVCVWFVCSVLVGEAAVAAQDPTSRPAEVAPADAETPAEVRAQVVIVHRDLGSAPDGRGIAPWDGVVPVSIPFPVGGLPSDLAEIEIGGVRAACATRMRWPDGSVALLRAWPRLQIDADEVATLDLDLVPADAEPAPHAGGKEDLWLQDLSGLVGVLEDPWGARFEARLQPDPRLGDEGADGWVRNGPVVWVQRLRGRFEAVDSNEVMFDLRVYVESVVFEPQATLTVVLDNTFVSGDGVLGPARFRSFGLRCTDPSLTLTPRHGSKNVIPAASVTEDGVLDVPLMRASSHHYLGDHTAKAFRLDVHARGEDAVRRPIAMPAVDWTRLTRAFGAHGGPGPIEATDDELEAIARQHLVTWAREARFGPYGGFGDPEDAAAQGTPRNGPSQLHDVLRWRSPELLAIAEAQVLQHTLRPTPGRDPRLPQATAHLRQGLAPSMVARPHGFTRLDYEHFSVDLLFDAYWLTDDPLAFDEIARMGSGLKAVLGEGLPFQTSRGEGWCLQAAAQVHRVLGSTKEGPCAGLLEWVARRFVDQVVPTMGRVEQPFAIRQPPHDDALGAVDHPFDAPWQIAALVHGLVAVWRETQQPVFGIVAIRCAEQMATLGWVEDVGPKYLMSAIDTTRYRMPVGFEPRDGTALHQIGAFVLAEELAAITNSEAGRSLFGSRADFLMEDRPEDRTASSSRWFQLYLDRRHR